MFKITKTEFTSTGVSKISRLLAAARSARDVVATVGAEAKEKVANEYDANYSYEWEKDTLMAGTPTDTIHGPNKRGGKIGDDHSLVGDITRTCVAIRASSVSVETTSTGAKALMLHADEINNLTKIRYTRMRANNILETLPFNGHYFQSLESFGDTVWYVTPRGDNTGQSLTPEIGIGVRGMIKQLRPFMIVDIVALRERPSTVNRIKEIMGNIIRGQT
jgi:hypothetical protein